MASGFSYGCRFSTNSILVCLCTIFFNLIICYRYGTDGVFTERLENFSIYGVSGDFMSEVSCMRSNELSKEVTHVALVAKKAKSPVSKLGHSVGSVVVDAGGASRANVENSHTMIYGGGEVAVRNDYYSVVVPIEVIGGLMG